MRRITGLVYDEQYLRHPGNRRRSARPAWRPSCSASRTPASWRKCSSSPLSGPPPLIERLHDPGYMKRFEEACQNGRSIFGVPDCGIAPESYGRAAGGGRDLAAIENVMNGTVQNAFCAVRPPATTRTQPGPGLLFLQQYRPRGPPTSWKIFTWSGWR